MKVGFIGLGRMGKPMALNVLKAGFLLTVHNRSQGAVEELVAAGARRASSPAQVAQECDVVLTCLPDVPTSDHIFLGQDGLLAAARPGQVFVDHSTVTLALSRRCAQAATARGAYFLDTPISGGPERAADGTLTIMVGGDRQAFDKVEPVFKAMGKNVRYAGGSGAGTVFKLINQLLASINICAVAEAMVMAEKAGVDRQALLEVLNTSWGGSAVLARRGRSSWPGSSTGERPSSIWPRTSASSRSWPGTWGCPSRWAIALPACCARPWTRAWAKRTSLPWWCPWRSEQGRENRA